MCEWCVVNNQVETIALGLPASNASRIECCGHDRGVDDAQALDAVDAQLRIDDGGRLDAHAAGAARMEECRGSVTDIRLDRRLVVRDRSRDELSFDQAAYR